MSETNVATVTITVDEYFDLRQKAEANAYLVKELATLEARFDEIYRRLLDVEMRIRDER